MLMNVRVALALYSLYMVLTWFDLRKLFALASEFDTYSSYRKYPYMSFAVRRVRNSFEGQVTSLGGVLSRYDYIKSSRPGSEISSLHHNNALNIVGCNYCHEPFQ